MNTEHHYHTDIYGMHYECDCFDGSQQPGRYPRIDRVLARGVVPDTNGATAAEMEANYRV